MKKILLVLSIILFCSSITFAQKNVDKGPNFDIDDFNKKFEVVQWLVEYDNVAWKTSDVVVQQDKKDLERLGAEWFAFKDKANLWHAVYGKHSDKGYDAVFHFVMDGAEKITRSDVKIDQAFLDGHARALATSRSKLMATIPAGSPRFNQYIRQNSDKTYSVWMLPAFQTNGVAVYGGEGIYTVDSTGTKLLKDESYFQPNFRGFRAQPPRNIRLDYSEMKKPSLGAIFFAWYYKSYFTNILIDNEKSTSTVIKTEQGYTWVHVEKEGVTKAN